MSATELMSALQHRGVELWQDGGALRYRAPAGALTDSDKATLKAHKAAILRALAVPPVSTPTAPQSPPVLSQATPIQDGLTPDERESFEERAAIMEHDGGITRTDAERAALARVQANRATMPTVARVVDQVRAVFGEGVKVVYAEEAGRRLGTPPDATTDAPATHVPPRHSHAHSAQEPRP